MNETSLPSPPSHPVREDLANLLGNISIDKLIDRLLSVRDKKPGTTVSLSQEEITKLI
jgi:hypothetical protein